MVTYHEALCVTFCLLNLACSLADSCKAEKCLAVSEEDTDTAWLQINKSSRLVSEKALSCDPEDLACEAKELACSLRYLMERDWPTRSYPIHPELDKIVFQLSTVCEGGNVSLALANVDRIREPSDAKPSASASSCSPADSCTTNVVEYQKQHPGAAYGMSAGRIAASTAISTINDILRSTKVMGVAGSVAFTLMNGFLGAFFPSAGGLPTNPCTYATKNWGRCVWEQVKPFVEEFVDLKIDQTFEELWEATIKGYQNRLWALNATAYRDSTHFNNGTIKHMPYKVRKRMFADMYQVHNQMVGDMSLFLTNHSLQTTAGAYLSQFASLHISVMTNLLGSSTYQTKGNLYVFGTYSMCYAKYVYNRSTEAFKARMSSLGSKTVDEGTQKCCNLFPYGPGPDCVMCPKGYGEFWDNWRECSWEKLQYGLGCAPLTAACGSDPVAIFSMTQCFTNHRNEVEKQAVAFWQSWLAPIPMWLNNVMLMQKIEVKVRKQAEKYLAVSEEDTDTAWLQINKSSRLVSEKALSCDPEDLACEAKELACSLKETMEKDWPTPSHYPIHPELDEIYSQLRTVCEGGHLSLGVINVDLIRESSDATASASASSCSPPASCTTNVVEYQKQHPGAAYGMSAGRIAASTAISTINDILRSTQVMGVAGSVAFTLMNGFLGAFFPSAGGLPTNPCTYATENWGRCVWEQVKPFVEEFVDLKIDQTFEELWEATIKGYQNRLWALNATAYRDSTHFDNGTIKDMPDKVRTRMFEDIYQVHNQMVGDMSLFLTNHSLQTTAGAYLSQFASLHISVMTNLLGSSTYQTKGNLYVFGTYSMCYAKYVYNRSTEAFKARMSSLGSKTVDEGTQQCCKPFPYGPGPNCVTCPKGYGEFWDNWRECSWEKLQYGLGCAPLTAACGSDPVAIFSMTQCFTNHRNEVEKQAVAFWQSWLAPIPMWLNNVMLMQKIEVKVRKQAFRVSQFTCPV
ncbi:unnamed protein product [Durusdinium trenchii]|uniref:Uncharacterized protein n=1 Tax=Durusdinium trenchii TaxID=1381693 RepID=A0ABP0P446_9DINO